VAEHLVVAQDILVEPIDKVKVLVAVDDKDEKTSKIELFEDGVVVQTDAPNSASRHWETTFNPAPGKHYYFVKVPQADGNFLWLAPIWVTVVEQ
jgi:hypothetical protein